MKRRNIVLSISVFVHRKLYFTGNWKRAKLITRDPSASRSYTLPSQPSKIPLRPAKTEVRAPSPDEDIQPLEAQAQAPVPSTEPPSNKRSAPDTEDVPVVKKQKVAVVEDDDDDFQIL